MGSLKMAYEVRDDSGIRGTYTADELSRVLSEGGSDGLRVRTVGTDTWRDPSHFADLRQSLPTRRPPPPDSGVFAPVAPMKTVVRVRAPHATPRLCAAVRRR